MKKIYLFSIFLSGLLISSNPVLSQTISNLSNNTFTENSSPIVIDSDVSVSGGGGYGGGYILFDLTNGSVGDQLGLLSDADPNLAGAISYSGGNLYLGNGSGKDIIGSIDAILNGQNGTDLKINFTSNFQNSSFESGLGGWTVQSSFVDLGITSILGYTTPEDPTPTPYNNTDGDSDYPYRLSGWYNEISTSQYTDGSHSLRLWSSMTTLEGCDVVHGPYVYSSVFSSTANDVIYFDWRAYAGSDAYDVFGYILNVNTGAATIVLNQTGSSISGSSPWATASVTIPVTGEYRFVFVSGTYDFSCGRAAGASLYIDNVRVYGEKVNDVVASAIMRKITYQNACGTSDATRNLQVSVRNNLGVTGTASSTIDLITFAPIPPFTSYTTSLNFPSGGSTPLSSWVHLIMPFNDPIPAGAIITGADLTFTAVDQGWGGTGYPAYLFINTTPIGNATLWNTSTTNILNYTGQFPDYNYGGVNNLEMGFQGYPGWQAFWLGGTLTIHYKINIGNNNLTVALNNLGSATITPAQIDPGYTDGCGIVSRTLSKSTFTCSDLGANSVTLTVTDTYGNSSSGTSTVTVVDNVPPEALCKNITVYLNSGGTASITAAQVDNGSNDACGIASMSVSPNTFDCSNKGANTVTLTVTDNNNNASTCTSTVTIADNILPTLSLCPVNKTQSTDPDNCTAFVTWIPPTVADNCPGVLLTSTYSPGSAFPKGTTLVTYTATDASSNISTYSFTVTVIDNQAPNITNPGNITKNNDPGLCGATVTYATPVGTDNCPGAITTQTAGLASGASYPLGTTINTFKVTDAAGYSTSCSFTVTVLDNEAPILTPPANITVNNNPGICGAVVNYNLPSVSDNCISCTAPTSVPNYTFLGVIAGHTYFRSNSSSSWTAANASAIASGGHLATITSSAENTLVMGTGGQAWIGLTDLAVEGTWIWVTGEPYVYNSWCSGEPNNAGDEDYVVTNYCSIGKWNDYPDYVSVPHIIEFDCAAAVPIQTTGLSSASTFPVGTTTNTFTYTDASNNTSTTSFTVTVVDVQAPTISCNQNISVIASSGAGATVNYTTPIGADNCSGATSVMTAGLASGSTFPLGTTTVTYQVTDRAGLTAQCSFTVTVIGVAPSINCPANITLNNSFDQCGTNVSFAASETVGIPVSTITYSHASGSFFPVGTTVVTATATNVIGTSSCTFNITVVDNISPSITCNDIISNNVSIKEGSVTIPITSGGTTNSSGSWAYNFSDPLPLGAEITSIDLNFTAQRSSGTTNGFILVKVSGTQIGYVGVNGTPTTYTLNHSGSIPAYVSGGINTLEMLYPTKPITYGRVSWLGGELTIHYKIGSSCVADISVIAPEVNDNCSVVSIINDLTGTNDASGKFPIGTTLINWTATDQSGNSSNCTQKIIVKDESAPDIITKNVNVQLGALGAVSIIATDVDNGSHDACGIASMAVSPSAFTCDNIGPNSVTLTVTDVNGNVSTGTAIVTVEDKVAPVAIAQNVTVQLDASGNGTTTAALVNNGSNDACGIQSLALSKTSFTCADIATNPNVVTLTVTDNNNNISTATANVTVVDAIAPVAIAQNVTVQLDASGYGSTTAALVNNGSNDACGIQSLALSKTAFTCADIAGNPNVVTLTVTDINGNVSTTIANVTVVDAIAPVALAQNVTVQLDAAGNGFTTAALVNNGSNDACGIQSLALNKTAFTCSDIAGNPNVVTLTVFDINGNVSTAIANVTVVDAIAPVALAQNVTVQLDAAGNGFTTAALVNNGSNDACGIQSLALSKTTFTCSDIAGNPNAVTLTVTDINGNVSTTIANVTVVDTIVPVALAQNVTVQLDAAGNGFTTAALVNNGSNDACGIQSLALSKTAFTCSDIAGNPNAVTLTVTDINGNVSTATANITVVDAIDPVAIAQNVTVQLDASGYGSTTAALVNNGSNDACGIQSLTLSKTAFTCSDIAGNPNVVTLTVTDINGNVSTAIANVTVVDAIAPVALAQNVTVQLDASGNGSTTADLVNNGSNDACGIQSLALSKTAFDCTNVGVNSVTLTVTDVNGNVTTTTAVVTVQDNIAPALTVPANIVQLNDAGVCGAVVNIGQAVASDNCSIATITNDAPAFFPVGVTPVTWTTVDVNGNSTTGIQTVEITNNTPVISGLTVSPLVKLGDTTLALATHADNNLVAATWNWGDGSSTAATIAGTQLSGTHVYSRTGLFDVTLTIEDACGKTDTEVYSYVVIYNPCDAFITGGGFFITPAGAYAADPSLSVKSNYGFNAKYLKGNLVPTGEFNFHINSGDFKLKATSLNWLMVNTDQAILKGMASVDGQAGYHFIASVIDGNVVVKHGTDYLRLIVWDNVGNVQYDNQYGDLDHARASNPIENGQIVIHKAKNGNCYSYEAEEESGNGNNSSSQNDNKNGSVTVDLTPVQIEMTVYPNPVTNSEVTIDIQGFGTTTAKIELTSLNGQLVFAIPDAKFLNGRATINFKQANLKSANYLIRVTELSTSRVCTKQITVSAKK